MNCDRCGKTVLDFPDLVFTAFAAQGGHFCKECWVVIEPEVNAAFEAYEAQRAAKIAELEKKGEPDRGSPSTKRFAKGS